jgi:beta-lactamase superfamily II metal-dependent hydrolase
MYQFHCLDVGQGSSSVLVVPSDDGSQIEAVVVDSADSTATIDCLERIGVDRVRLMIISHFDEDHIRGIPGVLARYSSRISAIAYNLDRFGVKKTALIGHVVEAIDREAGGKYRFEEHATVGSLRTLELLTVGGTCYGEIMHPLPGDVTTAVFKKGPHLSSVAVMFDVNTYRILVPGDLSLKGWSILHSHLLRTVRGDALKANLLVYPHHGGTLTGPKKFCQHKKQKIRMLSARDLLRLIDPDVVVISVGTAQPAGYGHPSNETFQTLAEFRRERSTRGMPFRLACTELTPRCLAAPLKMRTNSLTLQQSSGRYSAFASRDRQACPCAGTYSIQLQGDGSWDGVFPSADHEAFIDGIESLSGTPGCRRA